MALHPSRQNKEKPVFTLTLDNETFYRSTDAATVFGVTRRTINNWFRKGTMPGRIIGGDIYIAAEVVEAARGRQPVRAR